MRVVGLRLDHFAEGEITSASWTPGMLHSASQDVRARRLVDSGVIDTGRDRDLRNGQANEICCE